MPDTDLDTDEFRWFKAKPSAIRKNINMKVLERMKEMPGQERVAVQRVVVRESMDREQQQQAPTDG